MKGVGSGKEVDFSQYISSGWDGCGSAVGLAGLRFSGSPDGNWTCH